MPDREFENYLTLIGRLLRLSAAQRELIGAELRDHFESRLTELTAGGLSHDDAVQIVLEEFGDAAGLASQFSRIAQTRKRRLIMRCTLASAAALAATLVVAVSLWPENHAAPVLNQAVGQTAPAENQAPEKVERRLYQLQHVDATHVATTISNVFSATGLRVVAEQNSNSILASGPTDILKEISQLLGQIDREGKAVAVDVWFVDLQPHGDGHPPAEFLPSGRRSVVLEKLHQLEREGKVAVANHFQLTTLDNQRAYSFQGDQRPREAAASTSSTSRSPAASTYSKVGTTVQLQPRVSGNLVTMQVDAEKTSPSSDTKVAASARESKEADRGLPPGDINTPIVGQAIIHVASGDIVSLSGITSETTGSYQILVSAEVLPADTAAK